jgi:hypothetical protein
VSELINFVRFSGNSGANLIILYGEALNGKLNVYAKNSAFDNSVGTDVI